MALRCRGGQERSRMCEGLRCGHQHRREGCGFFNASHVDGYLTGAEARSDPQDSGRMIKMYRGLTHDSVKSRQYTRQSAMCTLSSARQRWCLFNNYGRHCRKLRHASRRHERSEWFSGTECERIGGTSEARRRSHRHEALTRNQPPDKASPRLVCDQSSSSPPCNLLSRSATFPRRMSCGDILGNMGIDCGHVSDHVHADLMPSRLRTQAKSMYISSPLCSPFFQPPSSPFSHCSLLQIGFSYGRRHEHLVQQGCKDRPESHLQSPSALPPNHPLVGWLLLWGASGIAGLRFCN